MRRATRLWISSLVALLPWGALAAPPSFEIIHENLFVTAKLSWDGTYAAIADANADSKIRRYDVTNGSSSIVAIYLNGYTVPQISQSGSVVVGSGFNSDLEGYRWQGSLETLSPPAGTTDLLVRGVSGDGSVLVGSLASISGTEAFLRDGVSYLLLGDLPGGAFGSQASDVSLDGAVIAGTGESPSGTEAYRWESGTFLGLGDLAGGSFSSSARAISGDGSTIVGSSESSLGTEAFRWKDGTLQGLGILPGSDSSEAYGVSDDGAVVVGGPRNTESYPDLSGSGEAFYWSEAEGLVAVETLLDDLGVGPESPELFQFISATDISGDGRTLVGIGQYENMSPVVWVAYLPEPSATLLLLAGVGGLALTPRARARAERGRGHGGRC